MAGRKLNVFLCHASQDKPVVRNLHQRLSAEGWIDPWLDEEKLLPGQDWDMEIELALADSDAVVVYLSNTSVNKEGYVQREINAVLSKALEKPEGAIFVIPVRLDDCEVPRRLRKWQHVDYFPQENHGTAFQRLRGSLAVRAGKLQIPTDKSLDEHDRGREKLLEPAHGNGDKEAQEIGSRLGASALKEIIRADYAGERGKLTADLLKTERQQAAFCALSQLTDADAVEFLQALTPDGLEFVPAGEFPMGSTRFENESPLTNVRVNSFYIARYLVTNGEFRVFMLDGGYSRREFWTRAGWAWVQTNHRGSPWRWNSQCWQYKARHPVEWLSWYEAAAYVRWMAVRTGGLYRLPTEAEWEKAASWDAETQTKREYPWGNDFEPRLCNLNNPHGTRPVGAFSPTGDSPYDAADMVGQVWQWTSSLRWPYPYNPEDGREDPEALGERVFRGGCWANSDPGFVRCASRYVESNPTWPDMNTNGEYEGPCGLRLVLGVSASVERR